MILPGRAHPKRVCDVCGALRDAKPGVFRVRSGRWVCSWHDYYVAPEALDRIPYQTFPVKPFKDAKPFNPRDTYERAEMELFSFLVDNYQYEYVDVTNGAGHSVTTYQYGPVIGAAWVAIYLYELIAENKRPERFVALARTKLAEIADWILARMVGGPHKSGYTNADVQWGAFDRSGGSGPDGLYHNRTSAAAGLALLRAYQVHGTTGYLDGARACAWFVRGAQCGDKMATGFASSDSAGSSRWHSGAFTTYYVVAGGGATLTADHLYRPGELVAVEFLSAFKAVVGDETIGSSDTAGLFSQSRAALVSTAIAEAVTFWTTGATDSNQNAVVNGFSTSTPFTLYNSYPAAGKDFYTGTGAWEYSDGIASVGTYIDGHEWAMGIRALNAVGNSSAATLFDWLMGFSSNSTYQLPATPTLRMSGHNDEAKWGSARGTYSPKTAIADFLLVRESGADVTKNAVAIYNLGTVGLLAALYASRQAASFKETKNALNEPRPRAVDGARLYLGPLGNCGLSFQPYTSALLDRWRTVQFSAQLGLAYRQAPQAFAVTGGGA